MFITSLSDMGVVGTFVIHETCGLAVAALAGSSSVSRKVGVGGVEGGVCMNRIQFEWCICRFVHLALEEMGAAGGGVPEMLDVVCELIGGEKVEQVEEEDPKEGKEGAAEVDEEVTQQLKAIFDVYASTTVDREARMIDEENYLQFLRDVKLLEEGVGEEEEEQSKIERVQAMELFRLNVSGESRDMGNAEEEEKVRLSFGDFHACLHCMALILEQDVEESRALAVMLGRSLDF